MNNEECPTCTHCGSDDLIYRERYANGSEHECRQCGHVFIIDTTQERQP